MYAFKEIVGNELIIKNIQTAIAARKLSHAYILEGAKGMGKKLLANTIAKTLECKTKQNSPCGVCTSCKVFDSGNHTDVFYIRPEKTKSLGIDIIREQIIQAVSIKPYEHDYKIFIIEHADTMTIQAQNALLKTLEEPPAYAVFFLLAESTEAFLATILSRCIILKLLPLTANQIEQYLVHNQIGERNKAKVYAQYAQGSIGQALEIACSEEFETLRNQVITWVCSIYEKDFVSVMMLAKEIESYKTSSQFLELFLLWYRDVLTAKKMRSEQFIIQKDKIELIFEHAQKETLKSLFQKIDAVWSAKKQWNQNANFQLCMEMMLMKLKESLKQW